MSIDQRNYRFKGSICYNEAVPQEGEAVRQVGREETWFAGASVISYVLPGLQLWTMTLLL